MATIKNIRWVVFGPESQDEVSIALELEKEEFICMLRNGEVKPPAAQRNYEVCLCYDDGNQPVCITLNNCTSDVESEWVACHPAQCIFIESVRDNVDYVFDYYDAKLRDDDLAASQEMFVVRKRADRVGRALSEEELHREINALCNVGNERPHAGRNQHGVAFHLGKAIGGARSIMTSTKDIKVGDVIDISSSGRWVVKETRQESDHIVLCCEDEMTGLTTELHHDAYFVKLNERPVEESNTRFLDPLIKELCIQKVTSKRILAALVMGTLRNNKCGLTPENEPEVKKKLMAGILSEYEFAVFDWAGYWDNDMLNLLLEHEEGLKGMDPNKFYSDYVWPYLRENEIVPGVRMRN